MAEARDRARVWDWAATRERPAGVTRCWQQHHWIDKSDGEAEARRIFEMRLFEDGIESNPGPGGPGERQWTVRTVDIVGRVGYPYIL